MGKEKLTVAAARRHGVDFPGSLVAEYDTEADIALTLRMEQVSGVYDYVATLDPMAWQRLVAWVEWQRRERVFQRQQGLQSA